MHRIFVCVLLYYSLNTGYGSGRKSYEGYVVIVANLTSQSDIEVLETLSENTALQIDMWSLPRDINKQATFMVSQEHAETALSILDQQGIQASVQISDIPSLLQEEDNVGNIHRTKRSTGRDHLDRYLSHDEMNNFLRNVSATCSTCTVKSIGQSYEHRDMLMIKIGSGRGVGKAGIWLDAGIHAREWIAPATALYIIDQLVSHFNSHPSDAEDDPITKFVWYILPSANPDGYEYSRTQERFWRKTRQPNPGSDCIGTDPNRNFGYNFGGLGTSPDPCSNIYPGRAAFSEPETANMRAEMLSLRTQLKSYISLHAYGQYWLCPWGYDVVYPDDYPKLLSLGEVAAAAARNATGSVYQVGSSAGLLYPAAGGSDDWAKGVARIKYSYTVELRDEGRHGFLLPESQIPGTGEEFWSAIQAAAGWLVEAGEIPTGLRHS